MNKYSSAALQTSILQKIRLGQFYLIATTLGLLVISCSESDNSLQCFCSQIGIDSVWADSSNVSCYKIPVNQTYGNDKSGKVYIAAIRAKKTGTSSNEPLLYLHGGPGIATLDNAERYINSTHWNTLRENHDLIMFDYRGTGYSEPSLCEDALDSLKNFGKTNPSTEEYKAKEIELYMKCRASLLEKNIDIQSFSSFQMAADADEVRHALKIKDWNVYGVSYGTMVSLLYIRHFPEHLKSVVLDSPFPPNAPSFDFIRTMNSALVNIQNNLKEDSATAQKFPTVLEDFARAAKRLNENPLKVDGVDFNGDDFANAMVAAFYKTDVVPLIPLALHEFANGKDSLLATWVETLSSAGAYGKVNDIQGAAITCYECKPRTPEESPDSLEKEYPHLASLSMSSYLNLCDTFRPESPNDKFFEAVKGDLPVLVLVGAYDPGTPPFYGEAAVQSLTNSMLIVVPNASHAAMHSSDCSFNIVKSFLQAPSIKLDLNCMKQVGRIEFATTNLKEELEKIKNKKIAKTN
ncbi:MAG: alpha/beta fold hydrolase [Cyclobacteriaceae bacterium]|nr:MAG: alpha/beta fold hydrolase [Cyclobacteriaceae bacterium]